MSTQKVEQLRNKLLKLKAPEEKIPKNSESAGIGGEKGKRHRERLPEYVKYEQISVGKFIWRHFSKNLLLFILAGTFMIFLLPLFQVSDVVTNFTSDSDSAAFVMIFIPWILLAVITWIMAIKLNKHSKQNWLATIVVWIIKILALPLISTIIIYGWAFFQDFMVQGIQPNDETTLIYMLTHGDFVGILNTESYVQTINMSMIIALILYDWFIAFLYALWVPRSGIGILEEGVKMEEEFKEAEEAGEAEIQYIVEEYEQDEPEEYEYEYGYEYEDEGENQEYEREETQHIENPEEEYLTEVQATIDQPIEGEIAAFTTQVVVSKDGRNVEQVIFYENQQKNIMNRGYIYFGISLILLMLNPIYIIPLSAIFGAIIGGICKTKTLKIYSAILGIPLFSIIITNITLGSMNFLDLIALTFSLECIWSLKKAEVGDVLIAAGIFIYLWVLIYILAPEIYTSESDAIDLFYIIIPISAVMSSLMLLLKNMIPSQSDRCDFNKLNYRWIERKLYNHNRINNINLFSIGMLVVCSTATCIISYISTESISLLFLNPYIIVISAVLGLIFSNTFIISAVISAIPGILTSLIFIVIESSYTAYIHELVMFVLTCVIGIYLLIVRHKDASFTAIFITGILITIYFSAIPVPYVTQFLYVSIPTVVILPCSIFILNNLKKIKGETSL
ncbi:MAG: hypothetical protein GF364_03310 [Candidatus Lokiarchaeota archaeon]|nr:hypothetical protein [Candidatus Lokiarchaeota archaeon]